MPRWPEIGSTPGHSEREAKARESIR